MLPFGLRALKVEFAAYLCGLALGSLAFASPPQESPGDSARAAAPYPLGGGDGGFRTLDPVHFKRLPQVLVVADLGVAFDTAAISEVAVDDLDRDGRMDIVVAWFATDVQNPISGYLRYATIFYGDGLGAFVRGNEFNLYIRDPLNQQKSIFNNGTAAMALGDFDGDGDKDVAVTAKFGDEIWFIENLGGRNFTPRYRHVFGYNSNGNFITPPETAVGDFDGDGRVDLAYLIDPTTRVNFTTILFWQTTGSLQSMTRRAWSGADLGFAVSYTRGLAVGDFNNDGRADLCFNGVVSLGAEIPPAVAVLWFGLNAAAQQFSAAFETLNAISSDITAVEHGTLCDPMLVISDRDGTSIEGWTSTCGAGVDYAFAASEGGFCGSGMDRGMAVVSADVNRDGFPDIVTRQKSGDVDDCCRIEIALGVPGARDWVRLPAETISTCGFDDTEQDQILRPRNLVVANMFWNSELEIVAGFGPTTTGERRMTGLGKLEIAIWPSSCRGDVNHDGLTDVADLTQILVSFSCVGGPNYDPDADLNRSGCVDMSDLSVLLSDFGCDCCPD